MNIGEAVFGRIHASEVTLDTGETSARLHIDADYSINTGDCLTELINTADCRYSAVRIPVSCPSDDTVLLSFGEIRSRSLCTALSGCGSAILFAITTGIGVDRLLYRLSLISPSRHFITDALASSLAEAVCNRAEVIIRGSLKCSRRFSPGYGDLPLSVQPALLDTVNAGRLLGITLSSAMLMSPAKSITAIMGVYDEQ